MGGPWKHDPAGRDRDANSIGVLVNVSSIAAIAREAALCIMLCANCHREEHHAR